jgi:hypothetical protein
MKPRNGAGFAPGSTRARKRDAERRRPTQLGTYGFNNIVARELPRPRRERIALGPFTTVAGQDADDAGDNQRDPTQAVLIRALVLLVFRPHVKQ